jgi:hypothetical protein
VLAVVVLAVVVLAVVALAVLAVVVLAVVVLAIVVLAVVVLTSWCWRSCAIFGSHTRAPSDTTPDQVALRLLEAGAGRLNRWAGSTDATPVQLRRALLALLSALDE